MSKEREKPISPLRLQIRSNSAALVKREKVSLPMCGLEVQVRGLMTGEVLRAGEAKRKGQTKVAIATEDPATGEPLWNPNSRDDLDEVDALAPEDFAVLSQAINRLSGLDKKLGNPDSPQDESSCSPSPADSEEQSPS